jgi:predicted GNAT family acetyltransferase
MQDYRVHRLASVGEAQIQELANLLTDCVEGGASVSFMQPLGMDKALAFWRGVADGVARGERALMVAEDDSGILGTVQLVLAQPDNQPHRADVSKMLVRRRARRRGLGEALMRHAEQVARDCGKWLLVLDTASPDAERLYERQGWQRVGVVPDFALMPDGALCDTTFYYRKLEPLALDNPVWNALGGTGTSAEASSTGSSCTHAAMALRNGLAARYSRDVSPLAGLREPSAQAFGDLRAMVELDEEVWLLTPDPLPLPPEWEVVRARYIDQMVYAGPQPVQAVAHAWPLLALGAGDVPDMIALAAETKPGPFVQKTIAMGRYLGVRSADGSLAAMSGTRMALDGYTEISAVCTSPEARGAGHARALMQSLMAQIQASGKTPFLHVKTENGAKQVYEKLGFAVRRQIYFSVIRRVA